MQLSAKSVNEYTASNAAENTKQKSTERHRNKNSITHKHHISHTTAHTKNGTVKTRDTTQSHQNIFANPNKSMNIKEQQNHTTDTNKDTARNNQGTYPTNKMKNPQT